MLLCRCKSDILVLKSIVQFIHYNCTINETSVNFILSMNNTKKNTLISNRWFLLVLYVHPWLLWPIMSVKQYPICQIFGAKQYFCSKHSKPGQKCPTPFGNTLWANVDHVTLTLTLWHQLVSIFIRLQLKCQLAICLSDKNKKYQNNKPGIVHSWLNQYFVKMIENW